MKDTVKIGMGKGIELYVIPSNKFKTVRISYCLHRDLDEDYTYNALVPAVLKRGCEGLENLKKIEAYLEEQYGAAFDVGVQKKGERQVLKFTMDVVNEDYMASGKTMAQSFYFLNRIITKPVLENSLFVNDYVIQEKQNLRNRIEGLLNDKIQYSLERCIQEMCKDEKFSRFVFGSIQDLYNFDAHRLYNTYREIISSSPLDIFVVGDVDPEKIKTLVEKSIDMDRKNIHILAQTIVKRLNVKDKYVKEEMDVSQAKLCIGFRTNTAFTDKEYCPLVVYNSVLGGGPHSKLFQNVREKASLAYYAFSRLEKFKGIMLVGAGIEKDSYQQALDIILEQMKDMEQGMISRDEFESAVKSIVTSLKAAKDQPDQLIDYYLGNAVTGSSLSLDDFIESIENVSMEELVNVSKKIKLDTVYFLYGPEKGRVIHEKSH